MRAGCQQKKAHLHCSQLLFDAAPQLSQLRLDARELLLDTSELSQLLLEACELSQLFLEASELSQLPLDTCQVSFDATSSASCSLKLVHSAVEGAAIVCTASYVKGAAIVSSVRGN
jgi:hypothetical protein